MLRNPLAVILTAAGIAVAGYFIYYWCAVAPMQAMLKQPDAEMEWLSDEFHLTADQFTKIKALHRVYAPKCDLMCQKIAAANVKLDRVVSANRSVTPEVSAALKEVTNVQEECRQAMLAHVYDVSAQMSPEEGARYLQMMKARLIAPWMDSNTVTRVSSQ
jgi:hypothetical protein